jgi:hypothetical protein
MKFLLPLFVLSSPSIAHAYLDPGTGSLLLQSLIGAIAAGFGVASLYWGKVKAFFGRKNSKKEDARNND